MYMSNQALMSADCATEENEEQAPKLYTLTGPGELWR